MPISELPRDHTPPPQEVIPSVEYEARLYEPQAIIDSLAIVRHKDTGIEDFRRHSNRIFRIVGEHLSEDLPKRNIQIPTPVEGAVKTYEISDSSKVLLVAILRSGLPAAEGISEAMPESTLGLVDIKRDHETSIPHLNYNGLEGLDLRKFNRIIIPDPMLATGGSAAKAIEILGEMGAKFEHMELVALVAAPEGIRNINDLYPEIKITATAIDEGLNNKNYIVPGLGDFGDRYYEGGPDFVNDTLRGIKLFYRNGVLVPQPDSQGGSIF